jgi:DNA-binding GntR family transcriptional regulator
MANSGDWNDIPSLPQAVADWIAAGIVAGRWSEGDRLRENDIATELGISRAPLREGIRMLHERGLVEHKARIGATVRGFSLQTIRDVYAVRATIEGWIVRQSIPNLTADDRAELRALLAAMVDARERGDVIGFFTVGWAFRQALYRGYPNAIALDVVTKMRSRLHSLPQVLRREQSYVDNTMVAYSAVCEHVDRGESDEVAHIIEGLLLGSSERMCQIFADGLSESEPPVGRHSPAPADRTPSGRNIGVASP